MADKQMNVVTNWKETGLSSITRKTYTYKNALGQTRKEYFKQVGTMKNGQPIFSQYRETLSKSTTANKGLSASLRSVGMQMIGVTAIMMMARRGFQGLMEYIKKSASSFRDFENAMAEVSTILDEAGIAAMPIFTAAIESMSVTFGKSAVDLANGLYEILSAAVPVEKALGLLYIASKASVAGLSDVKTAVDVLTSVLNAYGMQVEQMQHVSDTMFQSVIRGKFHFEDLASSLGYITPIAAQIGISFDELSASLATATRHGLHIDMVSRGLALALQNIIKPGADAIKVADKYGLSLNLASLRAKGLTGFLEELSEKTGGNAAVISKIIPNMRSFRVMMVLAGEGIEGVNHDMTLMSESMGKTNTAFGKMANTSKFATDIITQSFEQVNRVIGETTVQTDMALKQLEMFKGFLVSEFVTYTPFEAGFSALFPGLGVIANIIDAGVKTKEAMDFVYNTIESHKEGIQKSYSEMFAPPAAIVEKKTLADQILGGKDIDIQSHIDDFNRYNEAVQQFAEHAYAYDMAKIMGAPMDVMLEMKLALDEEYRSVMNLYNGYAEWVGAIQDIEDAIQYHSESIDIYNAELGNLREAIGSVGNMYDGLLGRQLSVAIGQKDLADMTEYLKMAVMDESYEVELAAQNFDWYDESIAKALKTVREYTASQEHLTAATKEFSFALAKNRLEQQKIQLIGMLRRRGLSRGEQRKLKMLQIDATKIQIEQAEARLEVQAKEFDAEGKLREDAYTNAKKLLDDMLAAERHNLWLVKDTRAEDILDLIATIETKEGEYEDLAQAVLDSHGLMGVALTSYRDLAVQIYGNDIPPEILALIALYEDLYDAQQRTITGEDKKAKKKSKTPVTDIISTPARDFIKDIIDIREGKKVEPREGIPDWKREFKRGTYYVPSDMPIMAHRGEQIIPAGDSTKSNGGGDTIIENVTINVKEVADIKDVEQLGALLASAKQSRILTAHGNTRYRMR